MSSSNDHAAAEGASSSPHQSDHLNLRVTYLHAGNPRPPHNVGAIAASTTIDQLKSKLEADLLEHPRPEEQRLIYQGRPLMQNDATLRDALRLEGPIGPLPYTIHIIVQARRASLHFRPTQPGQMPQPNPAQNTIPSTGQPGPQGQQLDPQAALEQAQRAQAMAHAQLSMLHQQLGQMGQNPGQMPPNFSATIQINGQPLNGPLNMPTNPQTGPPRIPNLQEIMMQQQRQMAHTHPRMPGPPPQGPIPMPPHLSDHLPPHIASELPPFPRPSSAPGHPRHRQTASSDARTAQPNILPPRAFAFGLPPPPTMHHLPHPFTHTPQMAQTNAQPTVWLASSRTGPEALLFAPGHGFFTSQATPQTNPAPTRTTQPPTAATQATGAGDPPAPQPGQAPRMDAVAIRQAADRMGQDVDRLVARGGVRPRNQAQADNDFWALVVQRGWLFLRLYMFTFVLSEPGTWRRYCLLIIGVIVCLLPRQNPLNNFFAGARRHVDNLIGPPQPQPRDRARRHQQQANPGQAQPGPQNGTAQPPGTTEQVNVPGSSTAPTPTVRGGVGITPEQNARRLLREHEQRNPNALRAVFYRMEQAVALFLASLIPGVGERHVAAREEARRLEEQEREEALRAREEEEKKRVEEEEKKRVEEEEKKRVEEEEKKRVEEEEKKRVEEEEKRQQEERDKEGANAEGGGGTTDGRAAAKDGAPSVTSSIVAEPGGDTGGGSSSAIQNEGSSTAVQTEAGRGVDEDGQVRARFS